MYTYSIIISKIARKINRNVDFPGFFKLSIRLSVNPHWKLRYPYLLTSLIISGNLTDFLYYYLCFTVLIIRLGTVQKYGLPEHRFELRVFAQFRASNFIQLL